MLPGRRNTPGDIASLLGVIGNPTRAKILTCLLRGPAQFTEILDYCDLDIQQQCGLLDYHLRQLVENGMVTRTSQEWQITQTGIRAGRLIERIVEICDDLPKTDVVDVDVASVVGKNIKVAKLTKDNLESFVDFYIGKYSINAKNRDRVSEIFRKHIGRRSTIAFLAQDSTQVVGYIDGEAVNQSRGYEGWARGQKTGILGYINSIEIAPKKEKHDPREIVGALIDAHEEYFRSRPNCNGLWVSNFSPEIHEWGRLISRMLQEKGFWVQNISYHMRKDFPKKARST